MKVCIFCGKSVKMTKEDAWPKWLVKLLRKNPKEKVPLREFHHNRPEVTRHTTDEVIRIGGFCTSCNSGWMSALEKQAQPILTPMILGNPETLSTKEQFIVASWLTKCAIVFMGQYPKEDNFFDSLDRLHFMRTVSPFDATNIWLARYAASDDLRGVTDHTTFLATAKGGGSLKYHVHTMAFGFLVLQIVSVKRLELMPRSLGVELKNVINLSWNDLTVRIWPPSLQPVHWPPQLSFDDGERDLRFFAKRFGPIKKR